MAFSLMSLGGSAELPYWMTTLGGSLFDYCAGVAVDSNDNAYVTGYISSAGAGNNDFLLSKYSPAATVRWQRTLGGTGDDRASSVAVDSNNNVYVTGSTQSGGYTNGSVLLAKYDQLGVIQWQVVLGGTSDQEYGYSVAIDSADNVYVSGYSSNSVGDGGFDGLLVKYNSSGVLQWARVLGRGATDHFYAVAVDSNDNAYVTGITNSQGAGGISMLLVKYNSSGVLQWQRLLGGTLGDYAYSVAIDSADNVYIAGITESQGSGNYDLLLAKYNSTGTVQWQRLLGGAGYDTGFSVAIDSADNVYVSGQTPLGAGSTDLVIAKYNSAGTIQWQRTLGGVNSESSNYGSLAIDSKDDLFVLGYTRSAGAGIDDLVLAKLPNDGSLTGTYVLDGANITYAESTLIEAPAGLAESVGTLIDADGSSLQANPGPLTDSPSSLTSHLVNL